jgi:hypothetical protein
MIPTITEKCSPLFCSESAGVEVAVAVIVGSGVGAAPEPASVEVAVGLIVACESTEVVEVASVVVGKYVPISPSA